jgi:hypothetical protein
MSSGLELRSATVVLMACRVNLLKRLGRLGLGALKDTKGVVPLKVVVLRAAGSEEEGDYGHGQYDCSWLQKEKDKMKRGLTTLVLHSTLGVVVASGSGSRGIFNGRLRDDFLSVIQGGGGARRGHRARLVGKDKRSGRANGRGVSGLLVVVEVALDSESAVDFMLVTEGRDLSLASLGRFGEGGGSGKVYILEGVVSGEGVGSRLHAGDGHVLEHSDRSAGRNRHIKLRDGLGCGREVTGDSEGHQLDADGTRSGEVVVDGACAALEAHGDALDEVGERHSVVV